MKNKKITVKYGTGTISCEVPELMYVESADHSNTLIQHEQQDHKSELEIIEEALEDPIGTKRLPDIIEPNDNVAIITSDITRPFPTKTVLPIVIKKLIEIGVSEENILVVFALGSHRHHTEEEKRNMMGAYAYFSNVQRCDSDVNNCVCLGTTSRGTYVDVFKPVVECSKIICMGNIEPHYFVGFSGGYKAILPGVSSLRTIRNNHSFMIDPNATSREIDHNPVRSDINEISKYIKIDYLVNVILDENKKITYCVTGDPIQAHRAGCSKYNELFPEINSEKTNIVIAAAGNPKDRNIYQAHKILDLATKQTISGGTIIWCMNANEGFGHPLFEEWMTTKTPQEIIQCINDNFVLGGHKAAAIAKIVLNYNIIVVSSLHKQTIEKMSMIPADSLQDAVNTAVKIEGSTAKISVLKYGLVSTDD